MTGLYMSPLNKLINYSLSALIFSMVTSLFVYLMPSQPFYIFPGACMYIPIGLWLTYFLGTVLLNRKELARAFRFYGYDTSFAGNCDWDDISGDINSMARSEFSCEAANIIAGFYKDLYEDISINERRLIMASLQDNHSVWPGDHYIEYRGTKNGIDRIFRARKDLNRFCEQHNLYKRYFTEGLKPDTGKLSLNS